MEIHSNSPKLYYGFNNLLKIVQFLVFTTQILHIFQPDIPLCFQWVE